MWYKILDFNNVVVDGPVDLEGSSSSSTAQRLRAWLPRFARRLEHRRPGRGDSFGDQAHERSLVGWKREAEVDVVCLSARTSTLLSLELKTLFSPLSHTSLCITITTPSPGYQQEISQAR
jgi:hypothetical protein